ncbi:hypothetical protein SAMN04244560_00871 [Thermoanaerobacter thermohydrosulfuricus]|uniref:Uncharacterized protein n=1 Tax=Thermoanaerobacter thermohydrosulfuricus TaxID=1516 RepID=A0A1G7LTU3_THETY|nr:hypothetical protein [Thermoanaerobacter thermohydrosulfuricus]SDF52831.1 hypothetical protein SAMN04244560_00871 [Thermoanaerobacter thermohydrosulfuricus]
MRLTKKEKEVIAKLIKAEIETLTSFINEKQSSTMNFNSTQKYIQNLENILKKIDS